MAVTNVATIFFFKMTLYQFIKLIASQKMKMQMEHRLSGIFSAIINNAVTRLIHAQFLGYFLRCQQNMTQKCLILLLCII